MMHKRYRPSNGTEGGHFMAQFCKRCIRDKPTRDGDAAHGCEIIVRTMIHDVEDDDYPDEWIVKEGTKFEGECTAFERDWGVE